MNGSKLNCGWRESNTPPTFTLKQTDMRKFKLLSSHQRFAPLVYGNTYDGDFKPKGWIHTIEAVARNSNDWQEVTEPEPIETNWISVKDRLPEFSFRSVLAFESTNFNSYTATFDGRNWYHFGGLGGIINGEVSHWMPLPERPKE